MRTCQANNCNNPVWGTDKITRLGYCKFHQHLRTDYQKSNPKVTPCKDPTGEKVLFETILTTRPHISFVSAKIIPYPNHMNCHHVLPKSHYELYRLLDRNIILLSDEEHHQVHNIAKSDLLKLNPGWTKYFDLKEKLKTEYNSKT